MSEARNFRFFAGVLLPAVGVFALDVFFLPLGVAVWLPYIAVVLVSLWLARPWQTYCTAALCSVLTLAGMFLSPAGADFWLAGVNRLMAVLAFWIAAAVGVGARRTRELERSNQALQEEIQRRQALEAQLLRTQRLESIGVLTGGIAHDFNNLLTPILMAAKLLREERPAEERTQLLETLQASAERAAELVRKLLAFAGGMEGERRVVHVKNVIAEIHEIVEHTFPKTVDIRIHIPAGLPPVLADPTQLSQVLMNLSVNARDAMPSGGTLFIAAARVAVNEAYTARHPEARPGVYVRITVEDTGTGMTAEVLDKAFDPFFTTKTPGKGTGLGLSTALGIVRSHGGFLHVDSDVGRGSRFAVFFPTACEEGGRPETPARVAARRGSGELVLVVDDEVAALQTVKAILQRSGYRVLTARGGAEALEIYERDRVEIRGVLLDMMMPDMDGLTVMARLRERDPHVQLIASSGLHVAGRTAETLAANRVPFLSKPYSDEQLLMALAQVLQPP